MNKVIFVKKNIITIIIIIINKPLFIDLKKIDYLQIQEYEY